jgi:serine/threonine-protein kinase RsbW
MADQKPTTENKAARVHAEPPPELGRIILEREIPSDVALVTPLIIRVTEFLQEGSVIPPDFKNKLQLCLDEALRNAVIHGNRRDFAKKVKLRAFVNETRWGIVVEDEGKGFALEKVPDPLTDGSLWGESGRGIRLIELYMDGVDYFCGGRVLVMSKDL